LAVQIFKDQFRVIGGLRRATRAAHYTERKTPVKAFREKFLRPARAVSSG
jgi:hypothetical protein